MKICKTFCLKYSKRARKRDKKYEFNAMYDYNLHPKS